jgi:small ligand-binding sensory domain FIST
VRNDEHDMGKFKAASFHASGAYKSSEVLSAALHLRETLKTPARMAFAFVSVDYIPHIAEFCETLRVDGHIQDIIGCTTGGRIEGGREFEGGSGFSLIACQGEFGDPLALEGSDYSSSVESNGWIALANPYAFPIEDWINSCNREAAGLSVVGGLASGGNSNEITAFINGKLADTAAVPVIGRTALVPALSQGCRPIGEPFTVTRADTM